MTDSKLWSPKSVTNIPNSPTLESHVEPFWKSSVKSSLKKPQNDANSECQCYKEYERDKKAEDR